MVRMGTIAFYICASLLLCTALYIHYVSSAFGDKLWELVYAGMWLNGKHLYTDIFPVSPPLIFWIYALPVAISHYLTFLSDLQAFYFSGVCLIAFSMFISLRLIALHPAFSGNKNRQVEFILLFCFIFIFRTNTHYFLDREHLFLVLVFPYLLRWMPSLSDARFPLWMRIITGCMAGIGFCIKPQCLLAFAGVQLLFFLWQRSARILVSVENIIIYMLGIAYLLAVWHFYPEYFSIVVPIALATYSATRDEVSVLSYSENALSVLVLAFLMFRPRQHSPFRQDIFYFCGLCPFFFFYALTNNNWAYTYYPLSSIALIITGFVLWEFIYLRNDYQSRGFPVWRYVEGLCTAIAGISPFCFYYVLTHNFAAYTDYFLDGFVILVAGLIIAELAYRRKHGIPTWLFPVGICACVLSLLFKIVLSVNYFHAVTIYGCYDAVYCLGDEPYVAELANSTPPVTSFGSISIDFARLARISRYSGIPWETRFPQLWMLPKFLIADEQFIHDHQWIMDYIGKAYADDLEHRKPDVMFVEDTNLFYTAHKHIDLVSYLSAVPQFRDAWKQYHFVHTIDTCGPPSSPSRIYKSECSFEVYRRVSRMP